MKNDAIERCARMAVAMPLFAFVLVATTSLRADEFAILRCYGSYADNKGFIDRAFAAQERHPKLLDEIWFELRTGRDTSARGGVPDQGRRAQGFSPAARRLCHAPRSNAVNGADLYSH